VGTRLCSINDVSSPDTNLTTAQPVRAYVNIRSPPKRDIERHTISPKAQKLLRTFREGRPYVWSHLKERCHESQIRAAEWCFWLSAKTRLGLRRNHSDHAVAVCRRNRHWKCRGRNSALSGRERMGPPLPARDGGTVAPLGAVAGDGRLAGEAASHYLPRRTDCRRCCGVHSAGLVRLLGSAGIRFRPKADERAYSYCRRLARC